MQRSQTTEQRRKVLGRDAPWDGPRPMRWKKPAPKVPQLALTFPAYDQEKPLADLFPEAHVCNV